MDTLTATEVAALFEMDEGRIRKDVEHGIFGPMSPPRFGLVALVYFQVLKDLDVDVDVKGRKKLYGLVKSSWSKTEVPETVDLGSYVVVRFRRVVRSVEDRVKRFETWKQKLVENPEILGGEPVFPKSRLAVRHIGGMLLRGTPPGEIQEDYPYLTEEDVEFARRYTLAYPRMGRPREREAPSR